ncbi:MAG: hypothetical protein Q4E66_01960, partial [Comamonadaceae bacterium]|nr:hypothetical protein [Comamonadaceae bacterium]
MGIDICQVFSLFQYFLNNQRFTLVLTVVKSLICPPGIPEKHHDALRCIKRLGWESLGRSTFGGFCNPRLSLTARIFRVYSMPKSTETRGPFWLAAAALAATLTGCSKAVVLNPAGDIAAQQGDLVVTATLLMLVIIVPVILLTLLFAWKYRQTNTEAEYDPEWHH